MTASLPEANAGRRETVPCGRRPARRGVASEFGTRASLRASHSVETASDKGEDPHGQGRDHYSLKQSLAARVDDHIEIAVEAEDGTQFKVRASSEPLDALTGDLETILDGDDSGEAA